MRFNNSIRPPVRNTTAQIISGRPTCEAVFYRWADPDTINIEKIDITSAIEGASSPEAIVERSQAVMVVNNDIMNCTIQKSKAACSGSFRLVLRSGRVGKDTDVRSTKPQIDYLKAVAVGDWCSLYMRKDTPQVNVNSTAPNSGLRMVGIVESVELTETDDPKTGIPQQVYIIQGRDFGKVFESNLYFNPILSQQTLSTLFGTLFFESLSAVKNNDLFTSDFVIKRLVDFFFGGLLDQKNKEHETWYVPASLARLFGVNTSSKPKPSFVDVLDYQTKVGLAKNGENAVGPLNGKAVIMPSLPTGGNIWSVMGYFANSLVNEMFCDLAPDANGKLKPCLFHRQLPFSMPIASEIYAFKNSKNDSVASDKKSFYLDLPRLTINTSKIKTRKVRLSDAERINHVVVTPRLVHGFEQAFSATFNAGSVQRYGLRTLAGETQYASDPNNGVDKYCGFCADLLSDWFFQGHMFYSGLIRIDGVDEHFHIGQNLYIEDIGELYHIEAYSMEYDNAGRSSLNTFTIEFQVSRGIAYNGKTAKFIANANKSTHDSTTVVKSILENEPLRGFKK